MSSPGHASQPLCKLIDYLTGYMTREAMLCFETALNPVVKGRLEIHFPEDPARTAARKTLESTLMQLKADLNLVLDEEKDCIQHMKNKEAWTGQSKAEMKKQKKALGDGIKKIEQQINEMPVQYVAKCRSVR
jgi:hypothetical protein